GRSWLLAMSPLGTKRRLRNFGLCAACGRKADIDAAASPAGLLFPIPPISHHHSRSLPERNLRLRPSQTCGLSRLRSSNLRNWSAAWAGAFPSLHFRRIGREFAELIRRVGAHRRRARIARARDGARELYHRFAIRHL